MMFPGLGSETHTDPQKDRNTVHCSHRTHKQRDRAYSSRIKHISYRELGQTEHFKRRNTQGYTEHTILDRTQALDGTYKARCNIQTLDGTHKTGGTHTVGGSDRFIPLL